MQFPLMVRGNLVIIDASNPHFANADGTMIDMVLTIADAVRGPLEIGFSATLADSEEHGRQLFYYGLSLGPTPYTQTATEQKQLIAAKRYAVETGGLMIGGMAINTEDRSKTLLNGSAFKAFRNPAYVLRWKTPEGFIDLDSEQVMTIADAVADFVQACFDREDELIAAVENHSFTMAMLTAGWPA